MSRYLAWSWLTEQALLPERQARAVLGIYIAGTPAFQVATEMETTPRNVRDLAAEGWRRLFDPGTYREWTAKQREQAEQRLMRRAQGTAPDREYALALLEVIRGPGTADHAPEVSLRSPLVSADDVQALVATGRFAEVPRVSAARHRKVKAAMDRRRSA